MLLRELMSRNPISPCILEADDPFSHFDTSLTDWMEVEVAMGVDRSRARRGKGELEGPFEQAKGKAVDKRTGVFAFASVLYECLTGRKAFSGDAMTDILGAVIHKEPDWTQLPPDTPSNVRRVLERVSRRTGNSECAIWEMSRWNLPTTGAASPNLFRRSRPHAGRS